jgi:hypothetical protein
VLEYLLSPVTLDEGSGERAMRILRIFRWYFERILDRARWYWSSREPPIMESQNDRDFAAVIAAIADRRKVDRSTAITVTPLFQPMLDRLSLTELKNYLFTRYPNRRGEGQSGKSDIVEIGDRDLKSFDGAFLYKDKLSMTFGYSDAWETVDRFLAVLLNDQL